MALSDRTLSTLAFVAIGLSALAFLLALTAAARGRRNREPGGPVRLDAALRGVLDSQQGHLKRLEQAVRSLHSADKRQAEEIATTVRRVALLRYDAFEDVGGRLSFSCALLDDHGNGVVLTSINGRQETRVYAKPITEGRSGYNLSSEEEEAIRRARAVEGAAVRAG
jgi:Protein of unknown function (DUF4446)